jgi:hypothetical protein
MKIQPKNRSMFEDNKILNINQQEILMKALRGELGGGKEGGLAISKSIIQHNLKGNFLNIKG